MISKVKKRELEVLFTLTQVNTTSLSDLSNDLNISQRLIREAILNLNSNIYHYFGLQKFITSNYNGEISIQSDFKSDALHYFYLLKLNYLNESVKFKLLVLLSTQCTVDRDTVLSSLYISESYLTKMIRHLNISFENYNFQIQTENQTISFKGDEFSIRLFIYLFLTDTHQSISWPFEQVLSISELKHRLPKAILDNSRHRSEQVNASLSILFMILDTRNRNNTHITLNCSSEIIDILELFVKQYNPTMHFDTHTFGNLTNEIFNKETLWLSLIIRIFVSTLITENDEQTLGELLNAQDTPLCNYSKVQIDEVASTLNISLTDKKKNYYMYFLVLFKVMYTLTDGHILAFLNIFEKKYSLFFKDLLNDSIHISNKKTDVSPNDRHNTLNIHSHRFLYFLMRAEKKLHFAIYVQMTKDFAAIYIIKNKLKALFNNTSVYITTSYDEADLIITDCMEVPRDDKLTFFLDSVSNLNSWIKLTDLIQHECAKQFFNH